MPYSFSARKFMYSGDGIEFDLAGRSPGRVARRKSPETRVAKTAAHGDESRSYAAAAVSSVGPRRRAEAVAKTASVSKGRRTVPAEPGVTRSLLRTKVSASAGGASSAPREAAVRQRGPKKTMSPVRGPKARV